MRTASRLLLVAALAAAPACATHREPSSPAGAPAGVRSAPARAVRQLQAELSQVFGAPVNARGVWAVDVRSLDSGETLFQLNAGKLMMPASNMKILTLATAAQVLGWDHRFTTILETTAPVIDGQLQGDLIVRGGGDPTINTRGERATAVLDEWAAALRAAGITSIAGRIIGDDQAFDDEGIGAGWSWDYLEFGYAAPVGALQFNENVAELTVRPGAAEGQPAAVTLSPGSGFVLSNGVTTAAASMMASIEYRRPFGTSILEVTGRIPLAADTRTVPVSRTVAVGNPTVYFAESLKQGLVQRGIAVWGEAVDFDAVAAELLAGVPRERRVLATTASPTLREIGTVLMKVSQNQYAETLLKAAGGATSGARGTTEAGRIAARRVFADWQVPADAYVMSDGSGLSRYNYVTASAVATILERLYRDERHRDAFVATLPIAGTDGTISSRMRRTRAEGNAVAKTGSIANVRSLSGYVRTRDGEMLAFSIIANDFVIPSATITWIADLGVEILANFTRR